MSGRSIRVARYRRMISDTYHDIAGIRMELRRPNVTRRAEREAGITYAYEQIEIYQQKIDEELKL